MNRRTLLRSGALAAPALLLRTAPGAVSPARAARAAQPGRPLSTLLVYNTVQGLLSGDLLNAVTVARVREDARAWPAGWPVVGVGTTNFADRTGELFPGGVASDLRFWWADPDSASQAAVLDLGEPPAAAVVRMPFLALAFADPARAMHWWARDVPDVHPWLRENLRLTGIEIAAVLLEGMFGEVKTTVSYNLPLTGLDLSGGYTGADYFRFGDYGPADWRMNGLYTSIPALAPVISTAENPLHLHGYQPAALLGGHITSAAAWDVRVTVWPLDQLAVRRGMTAGSK